MFGPDPLLWTRHEVASCPTCRAEAINLAGRVTFSDEFIQLDYRCDACGASFRFVRKPKLTT